MTLELITTVFLIFALIEWDTNLEDERVVMRSSIGVLSSCSWKTGIMNKDPIKDFDDRPILAFILRSFISLAFALRNRTWSPESQISTILQRLTIYEQNLPFHFRKVVSSGLHFPSLAYLHLSRIAAPSSSLALTSPTLLYSGSTPGPPPSSPKKWLYRSW